MLHLTNGMTGAFGQTGGPTIKRIEKGGPQYRSLSSLILLLVGNSY